MLSAPPLVAKAVVQSFKHFWGYIFSRIQGYIFTLLLVWSWKFVLTDVSEQVLFLFIQ